MKMRISPLLAAACMLALPLPLLAQEDADQVDETTTSESVIVVTGETDREAVEALGKKIIRPARAGKTVARFNSPVCIKVSGMPEAMSQLVKDRIEENLSQLRGVEVAPEGCDPNAFVGILNNVNDVVDDLRDKEPWLFQGLLGYQIDRIYAGSDAVRAWHVFGERNLDGTRIPGAQRGSSSERSVGNMVNKVERASRISQTRMDMLGAVVLLETAALREKSFRQVADYATLRILASTSDEVTIDESRLPTILTLFGEGEAPLQWTHFDRAFLRSLYELPANSRDGQIINSAASRYMQLGEEDENQAPG